MGAYDNDTVLTSKTFGFEIDGKEIPVIAVIPGEFRCELKDATMGNRTSNERAFTVTKPNFGVRDAHVPDIASNHGIGLGNAEIVGFGTWRVEAAEEKARLTLKELFEAFKTGKRKMNPSDTGSLIYKDRNDAEARRRELAPYQVNAELMAAAKPDALFMHDLPAHRGEEVTGEIIDGPQSVVWDEAENRLHAQKGILDWCFAP